MVVSNVSVIKAPEFDPQCPIKKLGVGLAKMSQMA